MTTQASTRSRTTGAKDKWAGGEQRNHEISRNATLIGLMHMKTIKIEDIYKGKVNTHTQESYLGKIMQGMEKMTKADEEGHPGSKYDEQHISQQQE